MGSTNYQDIDGYLCDHVVYPEMLSILLSIVCDTMHVFYDCFKLHKLSLL